MRRAFALLLFVGLAAQGQAAESSYTLRSPDGRIEVRIETPERLRYSVRFGGELLVDRATLSLDVDRSVLGVAPKLRSAKTARVDRVIDVPVPRRSAKIAERSAVGRPANPGGSPWRKNCCPTSRPTWMAPPSAAHRRISSAPSVGRMDPAAVKKAAARNSPRQPLCEERSMPASTKASRRA